MAHEVVCTETENEYMNGLRKEVSCQKYQILEFFAFFGM